MLRIESLAKSYADTRVFSQVSLAVGRGEFVALLGESGVGKSTLLNCIAGLDRADGGSVRLHGVEVTALDDDPAPEGREGRGHQAGPAPARQARSGTAPTRCS